MKEKLVIKRFNVGLELLKQEIAKEKTVEINNATQVSSIKVINAFAADALVRVFLFPGETKINNLPYVEYKEAEVAIVTIIRKQRSAVNVYHA